MATVFTTPIEHPAQGSTPAAHSPLTPEQQIKYDQLLTAVKSWETLPKTSAKNAEAEPLSDDEKLWLTRECLLRYLRATKWNIVHATKRVHDSVVWRREYGTSTFTADYISDENATGKQVLFGYDNEGRPCLYLLPNKQNTKASPKQVEHLVYMLERTLDVTPPGQETLALLIDFRNSSAGSNPSVSIGRQVLSILQNHYPERLGRAFVTHLPWYVTAFLKLISPFIDPVTKEKICYNEPLTKHIPADQLMKPAGGNCEFEYDHAAYWPAFNSLAEARRQAKKERWEAAGKHIGENEIYLWGGAEPSVGAAKTGDVVDEVTKEVEKMAVDVDEADKTTVEAVEPIKADAPKEAEPVKVDAPQEAEAVKVDAPKEAEAVKVDAPKEAEPVKADAFQEAEPVKVDVVQAADVKVAA